MSARVSVNMGKDGRNTVQWQLTPSSQVKVFHSPQILPSAFCLQLSRAEKTGLKGEPRPGQDKCLWQSSHSSVVSGNSYSAHKGAGHFLDPSAGAALPSSGRRHHSETGFFPSRKGTALVSRRETGLLPRQGGTTSYSKQVGRRLQDQVLGQLSGMAEPYFPSPCLHCLPIAPRRNENHTCALRPSAISADPYRSTTYIVCIKNHLS